MNRGFSLLELLVSITLILCLTFLALPAWHLLEEREARHGAKTLLLGALEQARLAALEQHTNTWVIFSHGVKPPFNRFCILQETEEHTIKSLVSWIDLPHSVSLIPSPQTVMSNSPPEAIMKWFEISPLKNSANREDILGSLQYSTQGTIATPSIKNNELVLNIATKLRNLSGTFTHSSVDTIHFSCKTGRAF